MKISKKKAKYWTQLKNFIINLERSLEKVFKKASTLESRVTASLMIVTMETLRLSSPAMEEDHTNYSRHLVAKVSVQEFKGTNLQKGFSEVT